MEDLRVGVVGTGGRGGLARHAHLPGKGSRVVACFDQNPAILAQATEWYGAEVYTTENLPQFLEQALDAVFVCTPDFLHEEHALAVIASGAALYLEKPMAITISGCDRILQAAAAQGTRLYVGHNMRHMTFVLKMKELIDAGAIGEVKTAWCRHFVSFGGDAYFKRWHADRRKSTGLLLQKAAHDIDVLHWLCGGFGRRVHAMGGLTVYDQITDRQAAPGEYTRDPSVENWPPLHQTQLAPTVDVEDISMLNMQLDNGVFAAYQQCHFTPDYWRNYTIIGTEGRIENFGDTQPDAVVKLWNRRSDTYKAEADETYAVGARAADHGGADARIVAEFVRYAREGGSVMTSPLAARYSVAVGCQATESLRNGGIVLDVPEIAPALAAHYR